MSSPQSSTWLSVVILIISCYEDDTVKTNDKNKSMRIIFGYSYYYDLIYKFVIAIIILGFSDKILKTGKQLLQIMHAVLKYRSFDDFISVWT